MLAFIVNTFFFFFKLFSPSFLSHIPLGKDDISETADIKTKGNGTPWWLNRLYVWFDFTQTDALCPQRLRNMSSGTCFLQRFSSMIGQRRGRVLRWRRARADAAWHWASQGQERPMHPPPSLTISSMRELFTLPWRCAKFERNVCVSWAIQSEPNQWIWIIDWFECYFTKIYYINQMVIHHYRPTFIITTKGRSLQEFWTPLI